MKSHRLIVWRLTYLVVIQSALANPVLTAMTAQPIPAHPRLLFTADMEPVVKQRVQQNDSARQLFEVMQTKADDVLCLTSVTYQKTGKRLLGVSRECLRRTLLLSMCYRLTGKKVYLQRAEKEMLAAAAFTDWNPSHFLDVAEMCTALALGYDWLYHHLSPQTRDSIRTAIIEKGLEASRTGRHGWITGNNNWNQVCNGGMTLGALAVWEDGPG